MSFLHSQSPLKKLGAFVLVAILVSLSSFGILLLEYGPLNFGDSDLPPYQPDTISEKAVDAVWFTVTYGAALVWLFVIGYGTKLLCNAFRRYVKP